MTTELKDWKNKGGTSGRSCKCGSWKEHWIKHSGSNWPERCSVLGCDQEATCGAHVRNPKVTGEFVIPSCQGCNNQPTEKSFSLKPGTVPVSANQSKTCNAAVLLSPDGVVPSLEEKPGTCKGRLSFKKFLDQQ